MFDSDEEMKERCLSLASCMHKKDNEGSIVQLSPEEVVAAAQKFYEWMKKS